MEVCEAIGDCGWNWWNAGDALWYSQFDYSSVPGTPAAQSGHIPDGGVSSLVIMLAGPGTMEFKWKVSSEEDYDFLSFSLGAQTVSQISGEQDWAIYRVFIPGGPQFLNWTYAKDAGVYQGLDAGWLDALRFLDGPGDVDLSGSWTVMDLVAVEHFLAGNLEPEGDIFTAPEEAADMNESGTVDASDLVLLSYLLAER
jgi:hypothetical protein